MAFKADELREFLAHKGSRAVGTKALVARAVVRKWEIGEVEAFLRNAALKPQRSKRARLAGDAASTSAGSSAGCSDGRLEACSDVSSPRQTSLAAFFGVQRYKTGQRLSCVHTHGERAGERRTVTVLGYVSLAEGPGVSVLEEDCELGRTKSEYYVHRLQDVRLLDADSPAVTPPSDAGERQGSAPA